MEEGLRRNEMNWVEEETTKRKTKRKTRRRRRWKRRRKRRLGWSPL